MTTDKQRLILEAAAKACGLEVTFGIHERGYESCWLGAYEWNPLVHPADCAVMCAELMIDSFWWHEDMSVDCFNLQAEHTEALEDHDNSRLKAWIYAATMVAAKIGGYTE